MNLRTYLSGLSDEAVEAFAKQCDAAPGHLRNVAYGTRNASPALAMAIEKASGLQVTRQELLPKTFRAIWPELTAA